MIDFNKLQEGQIILFDKPLKWTSFDVINYIKSKIQYKLKLNNLKIGHSGTLDPLATGLMIICTGNWTKRFTEFQELDKEYTGEFYIGATTPSYDLETNIDKHYPTEHITEELILETAKSFLGESMQTPPIYSAVKIDGNPAYIYARKGIDVKMKEKKINITQFDILSINNNIVSFKIRCSKGTYIRAIARDFGIKLNSGAYLLSLRRTAIGNYSVNDAINKETFDKLIDDFVARKTSYT